MDRTANQVLASISRAKTLAAAQNTREAKAAAKAVLDQAVSLAERIADEATGRSAARVDELSNLLNASSRIKYVVTSEGNHIKADRPAFQPGKELSTPIPPIDQALYMPEPPGFFSRVFSALRQKADENAARLRENYEFDKAARDAKEQARLAALAAFREDFEARCNAADAVASDHNLLIDKMFEDYRRGERDAVKWFASQALSLDALPHLNNAYNVAFEASSRRVVIEREIPTIECIPKIESYRYVKSSNTFAERERSAASTKALYSHICASIVVRSLRAVAIADADNCIDTIVVNAVCNTKDPATGRPICPTLISVSASSEEVRSLLIQDLDPIACLKRLRARVSPNAQELEPVRPVIEFDMVDARFVSETNVLGSLDTRSNLADLSPTEFESLMSNLFEKMGLETRQTRASRDGGVDCVAWDMRPVIGGKVVIQAKRYKNTVGVSAVRDLYGTMINENAAKGILVTTSGFGRASYEFAKEKPMELVSGENLLALLQQYCDVTAKIEFPDEWVDLDPNLVEQ